LAAHISNFNFKERETAATAVFFFSPYGVGKGG
jgi:hypothetical protein